MQIPFPFFDSTYYYITIALYIIIINYKKWKEFFYLFIVVKESCLISHSGVSTYVKATNELSI